MRKVLVAVLLIAIAGVAAWKLRTKPPALEHASVGERRVTVWSRLAQVREPVATLRYGARVSILERKSNPILNADFVRVRTAQGEEGWVEARQLMATELVERAQKLVEQSRALPAQARGHTSVLTNVRVEPGRSGARIFQFKVGVTLELLARAVAERPKTSEESAAREPAAQEPPEPEAPRHEDWLFIRGTDEEIGVVAGWVRGSFVQLDIPDALLAYEQGFRIVAWFELSRVLDFPPPIKSFLIAKAPAPAAEPRTPPQAETKPAQPGPEAEEPKPVEVPQYLAAGVSGGEGGPCDFTLIRFYTWNLARRRYETAYVESNFCGKFPIRATPIPAGANVEKSEAAFSFTATDKSGEALREYRMKQNVVRRLRKR